MGVGYRLMLGTLRWNWSTNIAELAREFSAAAETHPPRARLGAPASRARGTFGIELPVGERARASSVVRLRRPSFGGACASPHADSRAPLRGTELLRDGVSHRAGGERASTAGGRSTVLRTEHEPSALSLSPSVSLVPSTWFSTHLSQSHLGWCSPELAGRDLARSTGRDRSPRCFPPPVLPWSRNSAASSAAFPTYDRLTRAWAVHSQRSREEEEVGRSFCGNSGRARRGWSSTDRWDVIAELAEFEQGDASRWSLRGWTRVRRRSEDIRKCPRVETWRDTRSYRLGDVGASRDADSRRRLSRVRGRIMWRSCLWLWKFARLWKKERGGRRDTITGFFLCEDVPEDRGWGWNRVSSQVDRKLASLSSGRLVDRDNDPWSRTL